MTKYIIIKRKRFNVPPEIAEHSTSQAGAEDYAQSLYKAEGLDMVIVAEVHRDYTDEDGMRYRKVMKIERTCKHPNIQGEMFEEGGFRCIGCGMVFKPQTVSSNIELS